jgi:hypothetical protein
MKRWLSTQPTTATISELQRQLDTFVEIYNHQRPHRSLPHRATPATIYNTRPKAGPANTTLTHRITGPQRPRLRRRRPPCAVNGELHHIGLGRPLNGTRVIMLIDGYDVRVIHATTGEIIRTSPSTPNAATTAPANPSAAHDAPTDPEKTKPRT